MAFRHWQGSVPPVRVAWKCPTCASENTGPLEAGCTVCKAGADAKKIAAPSTAPPTTLRQTAEAPGIHNAFDEWYRGTEDSREAMWSAFVAGAAWQRQQAGPVGNGLTEVGGGTVHPSSAVPTTGGYLLAMVHPASHEPTLTDERTHATILAALAFYKDNQLAYGAVPGQLDAMEVSALIEQLTPREEESQ